MKPSPSVKHLNEKIAELETELALAKRNEEQLRGALHRLAEMIDILPDAMFAIDLEGRVTSWNKTMEAISGVKADDIVGQGDHAYAVPFYGTRRPVMIDLALNWDETVAKTYANMKRQGDILTSETINPPFRKRPAYFWNSARPVYDAAGQKIGAIEVIRDITEIKQTHEAVKTREQLLQIYVKHTPAPVAMCDRKLRYLALSQRWIDVYDLADESELMGQCHYDVFGDIPDRWKQEHQRVFAGERIQVPEELFRRSNGAEIWLQRELVPWRDDEGNIGGLIIFNEMITERKKAEDALQKAHTIINASPAVGFIWKNQEGWPVDYVTANIKNLVGHGADDFLNGQIDYRDIIHPEDLDRVGEEVLAHSLDRTCTEFVHAPYRVMTQQGKIKWVEDKTVIRRDDHGRVTHYQGIVEDITERKHIEDALANEKERLAVTLRSIGDAVISTDKAGCIALMNPIAEALTGWPEAIAVGQPLTEVFNIVDETTRQPCKNPVEAVLEKGTVVGLANSTVLISRDGNEYAIADSGAPILDADGQIIGVVLVFRDITEAQHIENELMKIEKLEALGVLAGGIAHDFNNFLTGIVGNISLARLTVSPGEKVAAHLESMEAAAMRAQELTQQLLTFSKGGEPVRRPLRLDDLVQESARFVLRGSSVRCQINFDNGPLMAEADEGQIAQVINNLVLNAVQAMPGGGVIRLSGEMLDLAQGNVFSLEAGTYVHLTIKDQGIGIQSEHLKKVFDPYFSTKQKGSGLGLAVVYSVIEKHRGRITVQSRLGRGTTFDIYLPGLLQTESPSLASNQLVASGSGRILVMDDEAYIRSLSVEMLEMIGYTAKAAKDGGEAIALYCKAHDSGEPFDAVILDLTVPGGMGGKETLEKLRQFDPKVKAIVSSGYSNDPVLSDYARCGFQQAVAKPYRIQQLSSALHAILGS